MNANALINMVIRLVVRKFLSRGINAGMDRMMGGKSQRKQKLTPEERVALQQQREGQKRARQAAKVTRRMSKF